MTNIAVFASGNGSDLQAIIDGCCQGLIPHAQVALIISNNSKSYALQRGRIHQIPTMHLSDYSTKGQLEPAMLDALAQHHIQLIFLAGYLKKLPAKVIAAFPGKILNIHPALLPKYGGAGMYGIHIHQAVIANGDRETGITIHLVDQEYDTGEIIAQCQVPVHPTDTPDTLAARVLVKEHQFIVETLRKFLCPDF